MIVDSPEEVAKFLHLKTLTLEELVKLSKNTQIPEEQQDKDKLIELIMTNQFEKKDCQGLRPQGIPLKSKDNRGQLIPKAPETYRKWRKLIFNTENNLENFDFVNKEGKSYSAKVWFIKCHTKAAVYMLQNNWYSMYPSQKFLIKEILKNPHNFIYHIVQKNAGGGNNFLMLHCKQKED